MVMVNVRDAPGQPLRTGVTVIVATSTVVGLAEVKERLPTPEGASPILGLLFVHSNTAPGVPAKATFTEEPPQAEALAGCPILGAGETEIVNVVGGPTQPFNWGVTVITPVWELPVLAALKLMLPTPAAGSPMAGLLFVQLYVGLPEGLLNVTPINSPAQAETLFGGSIVGEGLTVSVKERGVPAQLPNCGVTVMTAVSGLFGLAAVKLRLPVPEAGSPIDGLLFVQL